MIVLHRVSVIVLQVHLKTYKFCFYQSVQVEPLFFQGVHVDGSVPGNLALSNDVSMLFIVNMGHTPQSFECGVSVEIVFMISPDDTLMSNNREISY